MLPRRSGPRTEHHARRGARAAQLVALGLGIAALPRDARAQASGRGAPPVVEPTSTTNGDEAPVVPLMRAQADEPPPSNMSFVQYGVAFTAEVPTSAGPICDNKTVPCILGTGGGVAVRVGYRTAGAVYLGAAYEVSKQDPNNLYRLALLQQARVEGRYYVGTAREAYPYGGVGLGLAGYGNEWSVDTWGPAASVSVGLEVQIAQRTVVGAALAYRVTYLNQFVDTSGAARDGGIVQILGLDLVLEQREPTTRPSGPTPAH